MTRTYTPGQFVICGGADMYWIKTAAKTLRGAKTIASKTYSQAVGGKIEVGQVFGAGDFQRIERVAVKYGFDAWQQA